VPRIHLLDETLANQIAAGEVIERPAAVVKELVENALDAGALRIEIELLDGGRRLIRVRDDGHGMERADARLCLQRHATSKLHNADDLFAIHSYGFRGEALPSIAAVSRFSLLTGEEGALIGTRIEVEGGAIGAVEDAGSPRGTTIEVRDLFWNVPARRKFVKRAATEQAHALEAVLRLALPRTEVAFVLREDARILLQLTAGQTLEQRAEEALGRELRGHWTAFSATVRGVRAHGLAGSPDVSHGSAKAVWLFVNGRPIRDRQLTHAALRAYGEVGAAGSDSGGPRPGNEGGHDPDRLARVGEAIARFGARPQIDRGAYWPGPNRAGPPPARPAVIALEPLLVPAPFFHGLRYLGQLHRSYLVCEGPVGLVLIDQHAAHERMNYQRLRRAAELPGAVQPLLVPRVLKPAPSAAAVLAASIDALASSGIELSEFGQGSFAIKALPPALAAIGDDQLLALLSDLADELEAHGSGESLETLRDAILARAACHASVRAHDALAPGEAQALLDALDGTDYGARCAHGRPVVSEWSVTEIEKRFGRDYLSHSHAAPPDSL